MSEAAGLIYNNSLSDLLKPQEIPLLNLKLVCTKLTSYRRKIILKVQAFLYIGK